MDGQNATVALVAGFITFILVMILVPVSSSNQNKAATTIREPQQDILHIYSESGAKNSLIRIKTPEGWVLYYYASDEMLYVPDPNHEWENLPFKKTE